MKCKVCGTEIVEKEIKEKTICEFDDFFRFRKITYKQEVVCCHNCKFEHIEPKFYNNKKQALRELKKTPWAETW